MTSSMLVWLACYCLAGTTTAPALRDLPPEWPPLPDFQHPVDYVKWLQDRLSVPPNEDARPFYDRLLEHPDDHPLVKQVKRWMWGAGERGTIPGLFTEYHRNPPVRYAWNPKDHPSWEQAYQTRLSNGLLGVLDSYCRLNGLSQKITFHDPEARWDAPAANRGKLKEKPKDFGLRREDRLLSIASIQPIRGDRELAAVLLQDAWRAPEGMVDENQMLKAIANALRLADRIQQTCYISQVNSQLIRHDVYRTVFHALADRLFQEESLDRLAKTLNDLDKSDLMKCIPDAKVLLDAFDLMQFIYHRNTTGRIAPDRDHLSRLALYLQIDCQRYPELGEPPLDIVGQIDRSAPDSAVDQLINLFLEIRRLNQSIRPPDLEQQIESAITRFRQDQENHVLARQSVWPAFHVFARTGPWYEVKRRAIHLTCALHLYHGRNGRWPESLQSIRSISSECFIDPFSGKPFCYRATGDAFLLYSVAANGKDDGGKHDRLMGYSHKDGKAIYTDTDFVLWPVQDDHR